MSSPQSTDLKCPQCQAKLQREVKFCPECGAAIASVGGKTSSEISGLHEMLKSADSVDPVPQTRNEFPADTNNSGDLSGMSGMFDALESVDDAPGATPPVNGHETFKTEGQKSPSPSSNRSQKPATKSQDDSGQRSSSGVRMSGSSGVRSGVSSGVRSRNSAPTFADGVIRFVCRGCGRSIRAKEKKAGQQINCPSCKTPLKVPRTPEQVEKEKSFSLRSGDESGETISFTELALKIANDSPILYVPDSENESKETDAADVVDSKKAKKKKVSSRQLKSYTKLFSRSLDDLGPDDQETLIQEWKDALRELGAIGDASTIDLVRPYLDHHSRDLQRIAIATAGELRDPSVVPDLIKLLDDSGPAVRKTISIALGTIGDARAVTALLSLGIEDPHVKIPASDAISQIGPAASEPLVKALADRESGLVLEAVVMLGRLKVVEAARPLIRVLEGGSWVHRAHAAQALGNLGDTRVLGALQKALGDSNPNVRANAAAALGQLKDTACLAELRKCLQDTDRDVVTQTVIALGRIGDARAASALVPFLDSTDPNLRLLVAEALGDLGDDRAVPNLLSVLETEDEKLQLKVLTILRKLKAPEAVPALLALLKHRNELIRQRACDALGRMGDADVAERLETVLSIDPSTEVRAAAARALGEIADPGSVDSLKKALEDEFLVRCQAIIALGTVGDQENVTDLLNLLQDRTPEIKYHAAGALAELGAKRAISPIRAMLEDSNPMVVRGATKALEKLGEAVDLSDVKKAQRRAKYRGIYETILSIRSYLPEGRQATVMGLGALGLVVAVGVVAIAGMFLFKPPPKVVMVRGFVESVSFSPDGQKVCTGRTTGVVEVYDVANGSRSEQLKLTGGNTAVFSHSNSMLVLQQQKTLQFWDLSVEDPAQQPAPAAGHAKRVTSSYVTTDRAFALTRSMDGMVIVWNLSSGQNTGVAQFPTNYVNFAVSSDGGLIAGATPEGQVLLIDATTGQAKGKPFKTPGDSSLLSLTFSSDGTKIGMSGLKLGLAIYSTEGTKIVHVESENALPSDLRFTPDGAQLIGVMGSQFAVWNYAEGALDAKPRMFDSGLDSITSWDLSPDGKQVVAGSEESLPAVILDIASGEEVSKMNKG